MKIIPLLILSLITVAAHAADKPNIIVVMADDMGFADAGFTGSTDIKTPNLDKLAASGVIFKQGYVTHPFCGPSRAGFMAGRYQHRFGFETNPAFDPANPIMGIDPAEVLFPKRLQKVGYTTGVIGKWYLGAAQDFHPNNRGFDYFYGFLGGGHDYFRIDMSQPLKEGYLDGLMRNKRPADFEGYLTTALSNDAVKFVNDNKDDPFFLFLSYNCPHAPIQAPKEDIARYAHIEDQKRRGYAAMVDVMDRGIGKVVNALKQHGIYENTLIVFLSDNGGPQSSKKQPTKGNGSHNGDYRGGKGSLYDGGVHVPFMACWPAKFPAGLVYEHPVISLDIARTAVEIGGADAMFGTQMEGVDLTPYVTGKKQGAPHQALFWRGGSHWSVLAADGTKHLKDKDSKVPQMFYLPNDVSESNDILKQSPERAQELRAQWDTWNESNVANRMIGYKEYHKKRDVFYGEAIPSAAKEEGYQPEVKATF